MHRLIPVLAAVILTGCTLSDRYNADIRPADTSARTPLQETRLDRLEYGSHADSHLRQIKSVKP